MLLSPHISDVDVPQSLPSTSAESAALSSFSNGCFLPLGHFMKFFVCYEQIQQDVEKCNIWNAIQDHWWIHLHLGAMQVHVWKHHHHHHHHTWSSSHIRVTGHRVRKSNSAEGVLSPHIVIDALWPALAWCPTWRSGYDVHKSQYVSKTTADSLLLWNKEVLFFHSEQHLWHIGSQNNTFKLTFLLCLLFVSCIFVHHFYVEHEFCFLLGWAGFLYSGSFR